MIGLHAGVVSMMAASRSGGVSDVSPTHAAPSSRAKSRSRTLRANTYTGDCGNR
jgi:hypothetical protein